MYALVKSLSAACGLGLSALPVGQENIFLKVLASLCCNLKSGARKMPCNRVHMEEFYYRKGNIKEGRGGEDLPLGTRAAEEKREAERDRETEDRQRIGEERERERRRRRERDGGRALLKGKVVNLQSRCS